MSRRSVQLLVMLAFAALAALAVGGCTERPSDSARVGDPVQPAAWDLSSPESAVRSYLDWVSFSYRMANSEIPTATMTPEEGVRVDSYIQLNRQEGKGIEQVLDSFEVRSVAEEADAATLTARESWHYRYFSLETLDYISDALTASYDTTYTVVKRDGVWLVDRVEAAAEGEVQ